MLTSPDTDAAVQRLLHNPSFPRSNAYDAQWVLDNEMGPNALWLTEWLCRDLPLEPGMRVLDMGCGKALSSVFLAREFDVQVWANDLWVTASDNWTRIQAAGLQDRIVPIHAEARSLPYADGFFDAIVCVDSYFYYGTDDLYLKYFHRFVKPGGHIGIVTPGLVDELDGPLPAHLVPFWGQDCWGWHSPAWWRRLWERTGLVDVHTVDLMPDGWRHWLQCYHARDRGGGRQQSPDDIRSLETDRGRHVALIRMIASRSRP